MGPMTPRSLRRRPGLRPERLPALSEPPGQDRAAAGDRAAAAGGRARRAAFRQARRIAGAPVAARTAAEVGYCVLAVPLGLVLVVPLLSLLVPGLALTATLIGAAAGLLLLALATRGCRAAGAVHRQLAAWLLGTRVAGPAPFRQGRGVLGRVDARLRDGAGWRAAAYLLLRLPLGLASLYLVAVPWLSGAFYLSYPFWWIPLRHRGAADVSGFPGLGDFHVRTPGDAVAIGLAGLALLLIAPWTTRLAVLADLWLMARLLGRSGRAERIRELEASRAVAVDDAAATLRRVERDLHDGAQARLVALAMHLGRAREQLGRGGAPADLGHARDLVDAAHQGAKDALTELREVARGIHPPALDGGLEDALASLVASSALPATLAVSITARPTPAIETIAYFCVAELLTNAARHSRAGHVAVAVRERDAALVLSVSDDGDGGARRRPGGGLAGLEQRVATVDGTLHVASPPGGPTEIVIELPWRA
jgi:signal transduction histidine kinase